jgi:hypothetical protein
MQCQEFHATFNCKSRMIHYNHVIEVHHMSRYVIHGNKEIIDIAKYTITCWTLIVMFETHTEHIEKDTYHNEYVELLIRC